MGETRVRLLDTAEAEARGLHRSWWPLLDAEERTRAARLMDREARLRFVLSHGLLRTTLSEQAAVAPDAWRFGREAQGRPVIAAPAGSGLSFSLSRCPGLAAVMVSRLPGCGIDVDRVGRVQDPLVVARAWFHPEERAPPRGGGGARPRRTRAGPAVHPAVDPAGGLREGTRLRAGSPAARPEDRTGRRRSGLPRRRAIGLARRAEPPQP